jgi:hypothetical protein
MHASTLGICLSGSYEESDICMPAPWCLQSENCTNRSGYLEASFTSASSHVVPRSR